MPTLVIIGGGPAGLSAAIYAVRAGLDVHVLYKDDGALGKADRIENYFGFPDVIPGAELLARGQAQADRLGARLHRTEVTGIEYADRGFAVKTTGGERHADAVLLATGSPRAVPAITGIRTFEGRGVSYCATCDGMLYRGKTVAVIGAGAEARHDADFLEGIGCTVLRFEENLRFEIRGGEKAQTLVADATEYSVDCVFIIKESVAVTRLVPGLDSSKRGITVTRAMATNVAGVFAAGDCTGKPYQLAKAVGEGNVAALSACEYIDAKEK